MREALSEKRILLIVGGGIAAYKSLELTRLLRTVARMACPALLFKAEAIVGPADLPAYLGVGEHAGRVSDLAYHNSLMVQLWSMLATGEVGLATRALQQLPQQRSAQWLH